MITESEIYWITRCTDIKWCFGGCFVLFTIALVVCALVRFVFAIDREDEEFPRVVRAMMFWSGAIAFVCMICATLIPTTEEMAMIKVIPKIANSKFVAEELPADARQIYDLAKSALKEKLGVQKEGKTK